MDLFAYFGYGSLVNRKTLSKNIVAAFPTTLAGWRRHWQPRGDNPGYYSPPGTAPINLLTIHRSYESEIDGLMVVDRLENLAELNRRELEYDVVALDQDDFSSSLKGLEEFSGIEIHTYVAPDSRVAHGKTSNETVILQSYLDVVMQGFKSEFGLEGLQRFVTTTDGFSAEILNDRADPIYPRNQPVSAKEINLFAGMLDR